MSFRNDKSLLVKVKSGVRAGAAVSGIWLSIAAVNSACGSSPTRPDAAAAIGAPQPMRPAADAQMINGDQPVTLVVKNATVTRTMTLTYTFEVATDAAFGTRVYTKSGVAEGASGETSLTIDRIAGGSDYYWRARAEAGTSMGEFSAARKFTIGPAVVFTPPSPISPADGAQTGPRPALKVTNSSRQGPAGTVSYRFEIATSDSFNSIVASGTQIEGASETRFVIPNDLPINTTLFWRAIAVDSATGSTSQPSAARSFTTNPPSVASQIAAQLGVELWPGNEPTGANGKAVLGLHWEVRNLVSFDGIPFTSPPIEAVRLFDLMDRGMEPDPAIRWMQQNGYPSTAQWYPSVAVIGIPHVYLAYVHGTWELVVRVGA